MFERSDDLFPRNWSRFDLDLELSRLTWTQFEDLCELLIRQLHDESEVIGANRVGTKAGGVDFVAVTESGYISYQVKTEASIKPSTLRKWVREFLRGPWFEKTTQFILILSRRPPAPLLAYYLQYRDEVKRQHGVDLILCDASWIDDRLREFPAVAGRFFAPNVQLWYEDRIMLARAAEEAREAKESPLRRCEVMYDQFRYDDVGVHMSANLPTKRNPTVTCLITMAESGLYDAMITLGNDDVLTIFEDSQWYEGLPFHVAPIGGDHYLQIRNVRLRVPRSSAQALGDGVRRLREVWHERIRELDEARESVGYQCDDAANGVVLGKIDPRMWCTILEFANAHQHVEDGPLNIFYDHHAYLQVFSGAHATMRPGYHLMLETRPIVTLYEELPRDKVEVIWRTPPDLFGDHDVFSRNAWWPVNLTAQWLEEELIPAVWTWYHRDERSRIDKLRGIKHKIPELRVRDWWYAVRAPLFAEQRPDSREALESLLTRMQRHYSCREGEHAGELVYALDVALLRMLESADLEHWGYVRSKGDLGGDTFEELIASLQKRLNGKYESFSAKGLEWRMRTFGEICRLSKGLINLSDIEAVYKAVRPIAIEADHHNERLAHLSKRTMVFPV
jgi:hypothetical protein